MAKMETNVCYDADKGFETIAVFQDYIKRIRPVFGNTMDERFRYYRML